MAAAKWLERKSLLAERLKMAGEENV